MMKEKSSSRRHALVLGGTGAIGSAVVRALVARDLKVTFTFLRNEEKARSLASAQSVPPRAIRVDLTDSAAISTLFSAFRDDAPDVLVHCAATQASSPLETVTAEELDRAAALSGRATVLAVKDFAARLIKEGRPGHIVLMSALERTQSLPLAPAFAAAQGMTNALAMSLAKELGPHRILINVVAGGLVGEGMASGIDAKLVKDYEKLSALRRLGKPDEIAAAITFLALDNEYMTGKTLAANGGI